MRILLLPFFLMATGCEPAPAASSKRVFEMYMHPNGLSRCVDTDGERWKADASCCPSGFEVAGFTVKTVSLYMKDDKEKRRLYRHVVCMEK